MARIEVTMPKMGESIMEGTVVEWSKQIGDSVEQDETLLEIATDKVDSEVPAPEAGILVEILVQEGETVEVGKPIAVLETDPEKAEEGKAEPEPAKAETSPDSGSETDDVAMDEDKGAASINGLETNSETKGESDSQEKESVSAGSDPEKRGSDGRFYSPLVRSIAKEEGISQEELESLKGSGNDGRVTKQDVLDYLSSGKKAPSEKPSPKEGKSTIDAGGLAAYWPKESVEIIKMDRMRKLISDHMVRSKQTSAHVTTFAEADVTNMVRFREKNKDRFLKENGYKLTFTPFFIEATIQALREYPMLNSSVEGDSILLKRDINYGIAVALGEAGSGGLIVPVIKNAGEMNIKGLARATHELARKAREKQLSPDDLSGGTFTFTNYGSVGNLMGTPIINQPQVAIFGTGMIQKRPVVIEVDGTDTIAIRHMVYLSMSYDHRIIDGAMGGAFVQRVKQVLENFDANRPL
ncbi:dihydrolipoamide acetyltransferase family protein [Balneolaceae bacterium ANBcel3]|nr:dihydrolipoamide acetyltransferase family protein [Balneolaceae bacterium ANBcel3]